MLCNMHGSDSAQVCFTLAPKTAANFFLVPGTLVHLRLNGTSHWLMLKLNPMTHGIRLTTWGQSLITTDSCRYR